MRGKSHKAREGQGSQIWRQASGCQDGLCNLSPVKREVRAECGGVSSPEKDRWILGAIAGILEKAEKNRKWWHMEMEARRDAILDKDKP